MSGGKHTETEKRGTRWESGNRGGARPKEIVMKKREEEETWTRAMAVERHGRDWQGTGQGEK